MASPYYTKQPVYLEDPSGRFNNILSNKVHDPSDRVDELVELPGNNSYQLEGHMTEEKHYDLGSSPGETRSNLEIHGPTRLNFPYTPTISIINSASYSQYDLTHSNFQQRAFDSHHNMEINITAPMIVRSEEEALYVYNAAVWLRGTMKMSWMNDKRPGMPPPILRYNAHGIYENVPCVCRGFTWNLDSDIDYVEIPDPTKNQNLNLESLQRQVALGRLDRMIRVPVTNMFVLELAVTYSPKSIRENFSVKDYLSGNLKDKGYV